VNDDLYVGDKDRTMGNPIIHFEIYGNDADGLRSFYRTIFGWKLGVVPDGSYAMVDTDSEGAGIRGGIAKAADGIPSVRIYVLVPDINAYLKQIEESGGSVVLPRTDYGVVIMAIVKDPEGNMIGLTEEALPSPH